MKSLFAAALLLAGLSSQAFASQPDLYTCANAAQAIQVSYASTSFVGTPSFSVAQNGADLLHGTEASPLQSSFDSSNTALGLMVSAVVDRPFIADAPSFVYSVFIPSINLGDAQQTTFDTILVESSTGGFLAQPAVYQRIIKTIKLKCVAQNVAF
jgi:hypothetical protein